MSKNCSMNIMIQCELKERVRDAARSEDRSVSNFVCRVLERELTRTKDIQPEPYHIRYGSETAG